MTYNHEYINIKNGLVEAVLIFMPENILDVSYSVQRKLIKLQIVMLKNTELPEGIKQNLASGLKDYDFKYELVFVTKEEYNETTSSWMPKHFSWMDNLLFSKAEIS